MEQTIWKNVRATWLSHRPSPLAGFISALTVLILVIGAIGYWDGFAGADQWMPASGQNVFEKKQYWRLWTALISHADIGHLLSNMILFFVLGYLLVGFFGLWMFPTAALFFGGIINYIVLKGYPPGVNLLGASGVVYWTGGVWLALYCLLDEKRSRLHRGIRAVGVGLGVFMPTSAFDPQVSYSAHFTGFVLGIGFALVYYFLRRKEFKKAVQFEWVDSEGNKVHHPHDPMDLSHPNFHRHGHSEWN
ncbi:rhomboid family intramembrane serine protease [Bdellovibrio sp. HCB288]|uniref:rhomboid family intramembrane serine protease n=1 Tax=Bdellovibrio sp. HCB288 TaxID=3394355 RepID=UPI0039B6D14E